MPAAPLTERARPDRRVTTSGGVLVTVWLLVLAGLLEWPITRRGYLLAHDMVFTPHQPLDAASFGISSAAPRAVPVDALVAMVEHVVDGAVVARVAVLVPLLGAGLGCAALLARASLAGRIAAATAGVWNPFVVERLAIGQWALLWSYAALPWLVLAFRDTRRRRSWAIGAVALAAAAITPTGALIGGATAVIMAAVGRPGRRALLGVMGLALAVQLPWLLPGLTSASAGTSDARAVAAFGPRAEHAGGSVLSLLGGGGIWDADVVPSSRGGPHAFVWLAVLVLAATFGWPRLRELLGARAVTGSAVAAAIGFVLAALPAVPGGGAVLRATIDAVPGAGLLRDSQKWLVPFVVLEASLIGAALDRAADLVRRRAGGAWPLTLLVIAAALPLVVLPDAPGTLRTPLRPVHYPRDWSAVARALASEPPRDAVVLPFAAYRSFPWAPGRTVLDPAPRLLPVPTVVDDRLPVGGTVLRGENPRVRRVAAALASGPDLADALAAAHVGWVVVEHRTPGAVPALPGLQPVRHGADVSLYRVPGRVAPERRSGAVTAVVLGGDAVAALAVLAAIGYPLLRRRRGLRGPPTG
ncbi:hypothetical protein [uncultured Jatrophihabitans sp.]|uniref:hypothetical protein n=1 Tax=uncultured Jatrophihabitans sp. TaxID=1610747 RepID=UPI0035CC9095